MKFRPPDRDEVRALFARWELKPASAAAICDVDPRTAYRWLDGTRTMDFCQLYVLADHHADEVCGPAAWRQNLDLVEAAA